MNNLLVLVVALMVGQTVTAMALDVPPNALPGSCYTKVWLPTTYKHVKRKILARPASYRIVTTPARYRVRNKTVIVRQASEKVEVVPAKYRIIQQSVMVSSEKRRLVSAPAQYKAMPKRVVVKPARKVWEIGRGDVEKIDSSSGQVLCLVERPAVYGVIYQNQLVKPASSRVVIIPAKYKMMQKRVLVSPARARVIDVPARTKVIQVKELVSPAIERQVAVSAQYKIVQGRAVHRSAHSEWRALVCKRKLKPALIRNLQNALTRSGAYGGLIDGVYSRETKRSLRIYQKKSGLAASGYLTEETFHSLGVPL